MCTDAVHIWQTSNTLLPPSPCTGVLCPHGTSAGVAPAPGDSTICNLPSSASYLRRFVPSPFFVLSETCCLRMLSSSALRSLPGQAQMRASKHRRPKTCPLWRKVKEETSTDGSDTVQQHPSHPDNRPNSQASYLHLLYPSTPELTCPNHWQLILHMFSKYYVDWLQVIEKNKQKFTSIHTDPAVNSDYYSDLLKLYLCTQGKGDTSVRDLEESESFRLENTFKIIKSNHLPDLNLTRSTRIVTTCLFFPPL